MWEGCRCCIFTQEASCWHSHSSYTLSLWWTQLHTRSLVLRDDKNLPLNGKVVLGDRKMSISLLPVTSALHPTQLNRLFLGHLNSKSKLLVTSPCSLVAVRSSHHRRFQFAFHKVRASTPGAMRSLFYFFTNTPLVFYLFFTDLAPRSSTVKELKLGDYPGHLPSFNITLN